MKPQRCLPAREGAFSLARAAMLEASHIRTFTRAFLGRAVTQDRLIHDSEPGPRRKLKRRGFS